MFLSPYAFDGDARGHAGLPPPVCYSAAYLLRARRLATKFRLPKLQAASERRSFIISDFMPSRRKIRFEL
jgi:hypothetical protein